MLGHVPILLYRTELSLRELNQLLEVEWVTAGGVKLVPGVDVYQGQSVVSCDTDKMTFTGLTADVLDWMQRFVRLWRATGLAMWELDWAMGHATGGALDDAFLVFLSQVLKLRGRLQMPLPEMLALWFPLETRV